MSTGFFIFKSHNRRCLYRTRLAGSALGNFLGGSCRLAEYAGTILKVLGWTSKVTGVLALGMDAFDTIAMVVGFFNPDSPLVKLNQELHSNPWYNLFQVGVNGLAVFSGAAYLGMQHRMLQGPPVCFAAGTMILTAAGFVAIENIKAGDKVIATSPETFETAEKTVVETYIRETPQLIHLSIGGEVITASWNHPFYVKEKGFVNAEDLQSGDMLVNSTGETYPIENIEVEIVKTPETVYNFQVEDFHTYHVGNIGVLVHNANCPKGANKGQERSSKSEILANNRKQGREYEKQEFAKFSSKNSNAVEQITIKTESGVRTRVDAIGIDPDGNIVIREFKSSATAPLTNNQKIAFNEILEGGGVVVGRGKGIFSGGEQIPAGTQIKVIRPQ